MNANDIKLGIRLEFDLLSTSGLNTIKTYVSQLLDIVDTENIIIAAPIYESRFVFIPADARIRVVFRHEKYGLYSVKGLITAKRMNDPLPSLQVKIDNEFEKIQRRKDYRLDCNLEVKYRIWPELPKKDEVELPQPELKKAITKNLSGSGVCITIEEPAQKDNIVETLIYLNKGMSVKAMCGIIRISPIENPRGKKYELGMYFTEISDKDRKNIIKYIYEQQRLLLKKYHSDI